MKKSKYKEGLSEIKNSKGDNEIRITRSGNITYRSTEGYRNITDMRDTAINDAIIILAEYSNLLSLDEINELREIADKAELEKRQQ